MIVVPLPLAASSSIRRSAERPALEAVRTRPVPSQCGHERVVASSTPVRSRWRLISIRPKPEMRPTWMRARSFLSASFIAFSTLRTFEPYSMSMKSITTSPAMSRRRSWRAISRAASRLVLSAVASMPCSLVERPELMSIETSASVGLITR